MKLFYTPRSHFSRKVRILFDAWEQEVELVDVGNVADASPAATGNNPLMKVPTLVLDDRWIIDSDHIAQFLTRRVDPDDAFGVLTDDIDQLNVRAVLNGVMAAEVELILARRTGIETDRYPRFDKIARTIDQGLAWLEARADLVADEPTYAGFHLVCSWDHIALYELAPLEYPRLSARVQALSALPYVAASAPS